MGLSHENLREIQECSIYLPEDHPDEKKWLLSNDVAYYLSKMDRGENTIQSSCEKRNNTNTCTITFNHRQGELTWNRYYRFTLNEEKNEPKKNKLSAQIIACFTIP